MIIFLQRPGKGGKKPFWLPKDGRMQGAKE